jgi:hypothetical protein
MAHSRKKSSTHMSSPADHQGSLEKADILRREIQGHVSQGLETPRYEMTRQCSLASANRKSRLDFAKTIQGMANALPPAEKVYVIGADQTERHFYSVENLHEFDAANLHQILGKYLEPVPAFESYPLQTDDSVQFIAIVVGAEQPRPIVAKASVQDSDGRTQLIRAGDIWIKRNTGLGIATRTDIEMMYDTRTEAEAERRAQQRFAVSRDALEASFRIHWSPGSQPPTESLVLGPDADYRAYCEDLFASNDLQRFFMLLVTLRRCLIEKWHSVNAYDPGAGISNTEFHSRVDDHFTTTFQPALRRLVYLGLLLVEYSQTDLRFQDVAKLLVETFEAAGKLQGLSIGGLEGPVTRNAVALDVLLGTRVLGTYAVRMQRYDHLSHLLKTLVRRVPGNDLRKKVPFLFWPVRASVSGFDRIEYAWDVIVEPFWQQFFGSKRSFLDAACTLEFILHFNSYLATKIPAAEQWLRQYRPDVVFSYWSSSDLWRYPLEPVIPLAEEIYRGIAESPDWPFLLDLSIVHSIFQIAFPRESTNDDRRARFVQYLNQLEIWRADAASSASRFPAETDWGPILGPELDSAQGWGTR